MQTRRLREAETRLALLETIPGFFLFQRLGLLLLRLMVVLKKTIRVNYLLLWLCKLNRLLLLPFSIFLDKPKKISIGEKAADAEEEKDMKSFEEENLSQANNCSPAIIRRVNQRNRGLGY